ncbi:hypothetical protein QUC31_017427, partial [Theobroma cacao]
MWTSIWSKAIPKSWKLYLLCNDLYPSNLSHSMPGLDIHGQAISANRPRPSNCSGGSQILGLGNSGAALAIGFSYWFNVILHGFYMRYSSSCEKTRVLSLKDVFLSVKEFLRFGIPSAVVICLEWRSFEILVLLSGLLPNSKFETSVLSVCYDLFTSTSVHFYLPYGISAVASIRVSNELGAENPQAAQIASFVVMVLTLAESVNAAIILFCCLYVLGYAYTNEKDVITNVTKMVPILCLSIVMDSLHAVLAAQIPTIMKENIYLEFQRLFYVVSFAIERGRPLAWNVDRIHCRRNSALFRSCFHKLEKT